MVHTEGFALDTGYVEVRVKGEREQSSAPQTAQRSGVLLRSMAFNSFLRRRYWPFQAESP